MHSRRLSCEQLEATGAGPASAGDRGLEGSLPPAPDGGGAGAGCPGELGGEASTAPMSLTDNSGDGAAVHETPPASSPATQGTPAVRVDARNLRSTGIPSR
jgi:hypothetical protein